jgi:NADPH:quinone reductase
MATSKRARGAPSIPETMSAAAIDQFGPPEALTLHTLPVPQPEAGEVLIEIHAAGIGSWDAAIRDGSWRPFGRAKFPLILGSDGSGIVVAKGARVRSFDIGEEVYGVNAETYCGFYAEYLAVSAQTVSPIPRPLDLLQAGAAPVTGLTALHGIDDALRVRRDDYVLSIGASGGVGTLAVQYAKRKRARVLGAVKGRDAASLVKKLGADAVIDTTNTEKALEQLQEFAPEGLDAALALAGGDVVESLLDHVRPGGRIAYPNGVKPEPKRRRGMRMQAYDGVPGPRQFAKLNQAVQEARLRVPIPAAFPLAQAARAHEKLEQGHILGRLVLRVRRG